MNTGEIGSVIGVVAGMVGAALSWAAGLGVLTILFSVGIGSLLTYLVQSRTQKNAWKRESGLRKIDEIYGPLFGEINNLSQELAKTDVLRFGSSFGVLQASDPISSGWQKIKPSYRYYLIDENLRKELDGFFGLLGQLQENMSKVNDLVDSKLLPRLRDAFGSDVEAAQFMLTMKARNGRPVSVGDQYLFGPILSGKSPIDYTKMENGAYYDRSGFSDYDYGLRLQRNGQTTTFFGPENPNPKAKEQFEAIMTESSREVRVDPLIIEIQSQLEKLRNQATKLKESLRTKVEEPWRP